MSEPTPQNAGSTRGQFMAESVRIKALESEVVELTIQRNHAYEYLQSEMRRADRMSPVALAARRFVHQSGGVNYADEKMSPRSLLAEAVKKWETVDPGESPAKGAAQLIHGLNREDSALFTSMGIDDSERIRGLLAANRVTTGQLSAWSHGMQLAANALNTDPLVWLWDDNSCDYLLCCWACYHTADKDSTVRHDDDCPRQHALAQLALCGITPAKADP